MQTDTLSPHRAASLKASEHALFPSLHIAESTRPFDQSHAGQDCCTPWGIITSSFQTVNETHSAVIGPQNAVTQT